MEVVTSDYDSVEQDLHLAKGSHEPEVDQINYLHVKLSVNSLLKLAERGGPPAKPGLMKLGPGLYTTVHWGKDPLHNYRSDFWQCGWSTTQNCDSVGVGGLIYRNTGKKVVVGVVGMDLHKHPKDSPHDPREWLEDYDQYFKEGGTSLAPYKNSTYRRKIEKLNRAKEKASERATCTRDFDVLTVTATGKYADNCTAYGVESACCKIHRIMKEERAECTEIDFATYAQAAQTGCLQEVKWNERGYQKLKLTYYVWNRKMLDDTIEDWMHINVQNKHVSRATPESLESLRKNIRTSAMNDLLCSRKPLSDRWPAHKLLGVLSQNPCNVDIQSEVKNMLQKGCVRTMEDWLQKKNRSAPCSGLSWVKTAAIDFKNELPLGKTEIEELDEAAVKLQRRVEGLCTLTSPNEGWMRAAIDTWRTDHLSSFSLWYSGANDMDALALASRKVAAAILYKSAVKELTAVSPTRDLAEIMQGQREVTLEDGATYLCCCTMVDTTIDCRLLDKAGPANHTMSFSGCGRVWQGSHSWNNLKFFPDPQCVVPVANLPSRVLGVPSMDDASVKDVCDAVVQSWEMPTEQTIRDDTCWQQFLEDGSVEC